MSLLDEKLSLNPFTLALKTTSTIRWDAKYQSIKVVYESFDEIIQALDETSTDHIRYDQETRQQARSITNNMITFNFIVYLIFMKNLMAMTNSITTQFQDEKLDLITAGELLANTISLLETERSNESNLNNLIVIAEKMGCKYDIDAEYEFNRKHRIRKAPKRYDKNPKTINQVSR